MVSRPCDGWNKYDELGDVWEIMHAKVSLFYTIYTFYPRIRYKDSVILSAK